MRPSRNSVRYRTVGKNLSETQKKLLREFDQSCDDRNMSAKATFKEKLKNIFKK